MNKYFLILTTLFVMISITACKQAVTLTTGQQLVAQNDSLNKYEIELKIDLDKRIASGYQKVIFRNTENVELYELLFHLYPNAYLKMETTPTIGKLSNSYPDGFNPGSIEVSNVTVNGENVKFDDQGILFKINLNKALKPDEKAEIAMNFGIKYPVGKARFGTYEGITQFTNWYPILAVYQDGWQEREYNKIGESNYSEVADYEVRITLPKDQIVASTGSVVSELETGEKGLKTVLILAKKVRDFAWVSSKDFEIEENIVDGIKIKSFYTEKNKVLGTKADDLAVEVLAYYNKLIGKFPYDEFDIVETYLVGGGMEYPQLITLGQSHYEKQSSLEHVIAHEAAHQWWYVAVGNDEKKSPWLDEGFANFFTDLYMSSKAEQEEALEAVMNQYHAGKLSSIPVNSSVDRFTSWSDYLQIAYKSGALALYNLRDDIGEERFLKIMKAYYNEYKFENATTEDFIHIVKKIAGNEAGEKLANIVNGREK